MSEFYSSSPVFNLFQGEVMKALGCPEGEGFTKAVEMYAFPSPGHTETPQGYYRYCFEGGANGVSEQDVEYDEIQEIKNLVERSMKVENGKADIIKTDEARENIRNAVEKMLLLLEDRFGKEFLQEMKNAEHENLEIPPPPLSTEIHGEIHPM